MGQAQENDGSGGGGRRRRGAILIALVALACELAMLRRRGYGFGGNVVVRCRRGHLFTTVWLPAASLKSVKLGWWRLQRCPVGGHISLVSPVPRSELSRSQLRAAARHRDIPIP